MSDEKSIEIHQWAELEKELEGALHRIDRDDPEPEALARLRRVLRDSDEFREAYGDLARHARHEIIKELTKSRFEWESVRAW